VVVSTEEEAAALALPSEEVEDELLGAA
jgi:hypothetical protein